MDEYITRGGHGDGYGLVVFDSFCRVQIGEAQSCLPDFWQPNRWHPLTQQLAQLQPGCAIRGFWVYF
jgi:hypothetical protein